MSKYERVGEISVDSGQVMLVDPCYIDKDFNTEWDKEAINGKEDPGLNYNGACRITLGEVGCGNFGGNIMAFATRTAHGDGVYPVYVKRDPDGRIIAMKIKFT